MCHMEVEIATAVHVSEFDGERYYFCCAGCKKIFESNPAQFVVPDNPSGTVSLGSINIK